MPVQRWNDDRLDDMARNVDRTSKAQSETAELARDTARQLNELTKTQNTRSNHEWALFLMVLTITVTELVNLLGQIGGHP